MYQQLTLEIPKANVDNCEELLWELGALAVTLEDAKDDPLFEPAVGSTPLWQNNKIIALFDRETDLETVIHALEQTFEPKILNILTSEMLADKDWVRASLDQFKPQCFGENLWICPSWCAEEFKTLHAADPIKPILVLLDPGLAFGTGMHPTTQLCLQWLATHAVNGKIIMDYGCGSGILGIAALKLGAKQLLAIDHDSQALLSTTDNAKLNAIDIADTSSIHCLSPEALQLIPKPLASSVDIILANILANPLIELAPRLASMLAPKGQIVLSGLLTTQIDLVVNAYQAFMENFVIEQADEWVCIYAEKKG